ncbi:hypothetical protein L3X38_000306 [Prunus dulcis]|uniref:Uncharacterized protein n=1 Tax=Prunus dulcis TaxID=3755 RepID=A0AAD4UQM7_PRUDU|nr:hypothetical protein L3X38_000306 [Prunus dulcis]
MDLSIAGRQYELNIVKYKRLSSRSYESISDAATEMLQSNNSGRNRRREKEKNPVESKWRTSSSKKKRLVQQPTLRDILKKSERKSRFLFSFPGHLAPIGGGKIRALKNLGTKNPVLYLDFPQGRMKLFGTIVSLMVGRVSLL